MTSIYDPRLRLLTATLFAFSRASLGWILALLLLADDPPLTPQQLVELLAVFWLLPGLAVHLTRRLFAAEVSADADALLLRRADVGVEVPLASIERLAPWRVPLPGPGLSLFLRSGRRLAYVVDSPDAASLVDRLAARLPASALSEANGAVAYARARAGYRRHVWQQPWVKYLLFAFPLAAIFFNAHQHIAYGGTLGQYYLEGLGAWLRTLAVYWATMSMYLLLYAGLWRGLAELVAWSAAFIAPARAAAVRGALEVACLVLFYGGAPLLTALRFLS
jgi:hypothetical protein